MTAIHHPVADYAGRIEPGTYIPGASGMRIEDIVVCTEHGQDSLNNSLRSLAVMS